MYTKEELDFAYKYPVSEESKLIIRSLNMGKVDQNHLRIGVARLEAALSGKIDYKPISYGKLDYLIGYVYARMLVSCMKSQYAINLFAQAEARRSATAMKSDPSLSLLQLAKELGIAAKESENEFSISFTKLLENMPKNSGYSLANLQLSKGTVVLNKKQFIDVITEATIASIAHSLPVDNSGIPTEVRNAAKNIRMPVQKIMAKRSGSNAIAWIDRLLEVPISDCRHRTVNLILAPYLMTIKGLDVEEGVKVISNYIEKCKTVNPHTNVNESYIRYQCKYAKSHGMKPMTLVRAKNELSAIDFKIIGEE
jgi:hypothetical protein